MGKSIRRTPRGYDGIEPTSHGLGDVLPVILYKIGRKYESRSDLILAAWPEIIGERLASMTQAISFDSEVLLVNVKNSTLHSLLTQIYKYKVLKSLREKFPGTSIKNIMFRIG